MSMQSCGFLNLPDWHDQLQQILSDCDREDLLRLPVLGSENVENPWVSLDREDFFSAVQTGIYFNGKSPLKRFTDIVITADATTAISRLLQGQFKKTFFSAAIGSTFAFNRIATSGEACARPEKILVQNDSITGYILAKMENEDKTLAEATHEAQWEKIVSGSPNLNLHGVVTRDRLILQVAELFGIIINPELVPVIGISTLADEDILIVKNLGFSIRLLGVAEKIDNAIKAMVEPCIIPSTFLLAQARGGSEMVYFKTVDGLSQVYSCPGTSYASQVRGILSDLSNCSSGRSRELQCQESNEEFVDSFYVRFSLVNLADTLAQILQVFNRAGIEIETIHQPVPFVSRETRDCGRHCVVLLTGRTTRETMEKTLAQVKDQVKLSSIRACFRFMRKA